MWLVVALIFVVIEALTPNTLHWIFFASGAVIAFLTSLITDSVAVQVFVFVLVSASASFVWLKYGRKSAINRIPTNLDRVIGTEFVADKDIKPEIFGKIQYQKIDGNDWIVVSKSGTIDRGDKCVVIAMEGTKLVIEKK